MNLFLAESGLEIRRIFERPQDFDYNGPEFKNTVGPTFKYTGICLGYRVLVWALRFLRAGPRGPLRKKMEFQAL